MKCLWMEKVCKNGRMVEVLLAGVILVLAVILLIFWGLKPQGKIASVDMASIMNNHPAMQEAMDIFQKEIADLQKQVNQRKPEEKAKQQQKMQQDITQIAMRLQQEVMNKVMKDIQRIAKKEGYSYVIDKSALIIGGKDITEDVLSAVKQEKLEEGNRKIDVSEMPMIPVK